MWRWIIFFAAFASFANAQPVLEGFYRHQQVILATPSIRMTRDLEAAARIDGALSEWSEPKIAGKTSADSLNMRASVEGIDVSAQTTALSKGETLRIRVSVMPNVSLPLIGWPGVTIPNRAWCNPPRVVQLDAITFRDSEDFAANCTRFFDANVAYRHWLILQLRRELVFDGATWRDTVQKIDAELEQKQNTRDSSAERKAVPVLEAPALVLSASSLQNGHLHLELHIPWQGLPLTNQLKLEHIYLSLARCKLGLCQNLVPASNMPTAAVDFILASAKQYQVTACALPLQGLYHNQFLPGYFQPTSGTIINRVIAIADSYGGYFRGPDSMRAVPELRFYPYEQHAIGANQFLCGPAPSFWNGGKLSVAEPKLRENWIQVANNPPLLQWQAVSARFGLVMQPWHFTFTSTGEGQGGGEGTLRMRIWLLDKQSGRFKLQYEEIEHESCYGGRTVYSSNVSSDLRLLDVRKFACSGMLQDIYYDYNKDLKSEIDTRCFNLEQQRYISCKRAPLPISDETRMDY